MSSAALRAEASSSGRLKRNVTLARAARLFESVELAADMHVLWCAVRDLNPEPAD
jgi:hypothetical protein